jgi:flagellar motor switch protein FliN/FliY
MSDPLKPSLLTDLAVGGMEREMIDGHNINAMLNVSLNVQVVLGHARMSISQLLSLARGSVIEIDRKIGEPLDVMINDRLDLVKVGEEGIGITLTEIVKDYVSAIS